MKSLLFVCLLIPVTTSAQKQGQTLIDSLVAELPKAKQDTNKVKLLTQLAYAYNLINADESFKRATQALELAKELADENAVMRAYNELGAAYQRQQHGNEAIANYVAALTIAEKQGNDLIIAGMKNNIGDCYSSTGNLDGAHEYLSAALKSFKKLQNEKGIVACESNLGVVNLRMADFYRYSKGDSIKARKFYQKALELLLPALATCKERNNKAEMAIIIQKLGLAYFGLGSYTEAVVSFNLALGLAKELGLTELEAWDNLNLGYTYFHLGKLEEAKRYCDEALSIAERAGNSEVILGANRGLGDIRKLQAGQEKH